jgi:tRNA dimethylallyltransferase
MKDNNATQKIVAIIGPTASGKSDIAVSLALQFNGELISADSRQVYRGLDIGTGKITQEEMRGVPHHLLDVADPKEQFSVTQFQKLGKIAISEIIEKGKLPIICGGTGLYVNALIDNRVYPDVPPNEALRKHLTNYATAELVRELEKLDPRRAGEIDVNNPRRLVRAIEVASSLGSVPSLPLIHNSNSIILIGLNPPADVLRERINKRLISRLDAGMVDEVANLHKNGLSWERLNSFGLEYRYVSRFLQGLLTEDELIEKLGTEIWRYSRRQMTWWRKDERVHSLWENAEKEALILVNEFMSIGQ